MTPSAGCGATFPWASRVEGVEPLWLVTRHADILEISRQNDLFHSGDKSTTFNTLDGDEKVRKITGGSPHLLRTLVQMDAPDHPKYRMLTQSWFLPQNIRKLEEGIREIARAHVDHMASLGGQCDFVKDVALTFPLRVIMHILGVPRADEPRMLKLTQELFGPSDPELARYPPLLTAPDARSRLTIAWRAGDERLGTMCAYNSTRPEGFTEEDVLIMKTAAQASGLVWQRRRAELVVERRAAEMEGLERSKSRFLNLASHELKGPITVLRGYIAMLGDGVFPARELPELASLLEGRVAQMDFLVTQMVEAARLEDSRLDLRHELVDIRESVRDAVAAVTLTRRPHRAVETFLPTEPVWVVGDGPRIETICLNLLDNALKYSPGDAHVTCRVTGGEHPDVSVSDDGVGIPPDLIGQLFTRFGRIENPLTRSVPGTGLGLYISREVARQHGGDITVESTPDVGSTFTLSLPKAAASAS